MPTSAGLPDRVIPTDRLLLVVGAFVWRVVRHDERTSDEFPDVTNLPEAPLVSKLKKYMWILMKSLALMSL